MTKMKTMNLVRQGATFVVELWIMLRDWLRLQTQQLTHITDLCRDMKRQFTLRGVPPTDLQQ